MTPYQKWHFLSATKLHLQTHKQMSPALADCM